MMASTTNNIAGRSLRSDRFPYTQLAMSLKIELDHDQQEEVTVFHQFKSGCVKIMPNFLDEKQYFLDGPSSAFYTRLILFQNASQSIRTTNTQGQRIWKGNEAVSVSTAVEHLRAINTLNKPIAFFIGQRLGKTALGGDKGHAWACLLSRNSMFIKDSLPQDVSRIPQAAKMIAKQLRISEIRITPELPGEDENTDLNCILEYRSIAKMLEGQIDFQYRTTLDKIFNTSSKKYNS